MSLISDILSGKKPLDLLALQGGGSFCAFEAGILYYLLTRTNIQFNAVSGVSGGAINGVLMLNKLPNRKLAAEALKNFWFKDIAISQFEQVVQHAFVNLMSFVPLPSLAKRLPLSVNPLYKIIKSLDFDKIRSGKTNLFIAATESNFRKSRVIDKKQITPEWVMASTALSQYFLPVEIDGIQYVDGAEYHPDHIKRAGYNPPFFAAVSDKKEFNFISVRLNQDREELIDRHYHFECYVQEPYQRDIKKLIKHKKAGKKINGFEVSMPDTFHPRRKMDREEKLIRDLFVLGIREMRKFVHSNKLQIIV